MAAMSGRCAIIDLAVWMTEPLIDASKHLVFLLFQHPISPGISTRVCGPGKIIPVVTEGIACPVDTDVEQSYPGTINTAAPEGRPGGGSMAVYRE